MPTLFSFFVCCMHQIQLESLLWWWFPCMHWQIENLMRGFLHIISWDQLSMLEILFDHVREIFELIL